MARVGLFMQLMMRQRGSCRIGRGSPFLRMVVRMWKYAGLEDPSLLAGVRR